MKNIEVDGNVPTKRYLRDIGASTLMDFLTKEDFVGNPYVQDLVKKLNSRTENGKQNQR